MTADYMKGYLEQYGKDFTFTTTVSPGDLIYMPPTYIVCERGQAANCFGLRLAMLSKKHHADLLKVLNAVERNATAVPAAASSSSSKPAPPSALRLAVEDSSSEKNSVVNVVMIVKE